MVTGINGASPDPSDENSLGDLRDEAAAQDDDAVTEQLTDETISLMDDCVSVAFRVECNLRERGWDAEADRIASDLRLALFIGVAPRILRLESREPHQIGEDT